MLIVYSNGEEVFVCEKKSEKRLVDRWFTKGGRDINEYDREESPAGIVEIRNSPIRVNVSE